MRRTVFLLLVATMLAGCAGGRNEAPECAVSYRNPIIAGFHPDPSICRVGDDYYLVNSSFQYFPGVPIFHSTNLTEWEQIGNVLDRASQLQLDTAPSWGGIYASTIRYNDGLFYLITTNVTHGGNFFVTATDPRGPWSDPVWLTQGGIDPSLYFENGHCFLVSNPDDCITLCEIDPVTGKELSEEKPIWRGTGGRYPEGPHIYKKDGWYYLLISEGGTESAHMLTIARSRRIDGPYESNPDNPIFTHCRQAAQNNSIQGTGHGDFVQAQDGSWWIVFLAYRQYGGMFHHLGRETFLAPVQWPKGSWPVINGGNPIEEEMGTDIPPRVFRHETTTFDGAPGPEWIFIQNPDSTRYGFEGGLTLQGAGELSENDHPTFIGRRQESPAGEFSTKVSLAGDGKAGISLYQIHNGHADLVVRREGGKLRASVEYQVKSLHYNVDSPVLPAREVALLVKADGDKYLFYYDAGAGWQYLDTMDAALLSSEVVGGFTGVTLGLFAVNGTARFDWFDYREL